MPDLSVNSSPENLPPVGPLGKGHVPKQEEQPQVGSMKGQPERAVIAPLTDRTNAPELVTAEKVGQTFPTNIPEEGPTDSPTGPQKNMPDVRVKKPEGHARKSSDKLTKLMKELIGTNTKELSKLQKEMDAVQKKISEKSQKMQEVGAKKQKLEEDSKTAMYASKSREAAKLAYEAEKQQKILSNVQREVEELTNKMRELDQKIKPLEDSQRELFAKKIEGCIGQTDISQLYSLLTKENFVKENLKLIREKLPEDQRAKFDAIRGWVELPREKPLDETSLKIMTKVLKDASEGFDFGKLEFQVGQTITNKMTEKSKIHAFNNIILEGYKVLESYVSKPEIKAHVHSERVYRMEDSQRELFAKKIEGCIGQTDISQLYSLLTKENFVKENLKLIREKLPEDQQKKLDVIKEWIDLSPNRDVKEFQVMHDLVNLVCKKEKFPLEDRPYEFFDIEVKHRATDKKAGLIANPIIDGHKVLKLFVQSQEEKDRIDEERVYRTIQSYVALRSGNYLEVGSCGSVTENLQKLKLDNQTIVKHLKALEERLTTDCCKKDAFDILVGNFEKKSSV